MRKGTCMSDWWSLSVCRFVTNAESPIIGVSLRKEIKVLSSLKSCNPGQVQIWNLYLTLRMSTIPCLPVAWVWICAWLKVVLICPHVFVFHLCASMCSAVWLCVSVWVSVSLSPPAKHFALYFPDSIEISHGKGMEYFSEILNSILQGSNHKLRLIPADPDSKQFYKTIVYQPISINGCFKVLRKVLESCFQL